MQPRQESKEINDETQLKAADAVTVISAPSKVMEQIVLIEGDAEQEAYYQGSAKLTIETSYDFLSQYTGKLILESIDLPRYFHTKLN